MSDLRSYINITANSITAANIVANVPVANVTGLGNVSLINKNGNASTVLYGNGVFAALPSSSYSNTNVDSYLSTSTANVANLIINGAAPSTLVGSAGDTTGMIRVDSNYLYYCTSPYTSGIYTVGYGGSVGNSLFLTKGSYPTPQIGWTVTWTTYTWTIATVSDAGSSWQLTWVGTSFSSPSGGTATLTNPNPSNIWIKTPLSSTVYSNSNVSTLLSSFGSNTISTTGNISAGNLTASGTVSFATNRLRTSAPSSATGSSGDKAGDIVFDTSKVYYCNSDYVAPVSNLTKTNGEGGTVTSLQFNKTAGAPTPQVGWTITNSLHVPTQVYTIQSVTDNGSTWTLGIPSTFGSWLGGEVWQLTNTSPSNIWVNVPWGATSYSNTDVSNYLSTISIPQANVANIASNVVVGNASATAFAFPVLLGNIGNVQISGSNTLKYNPSTSALSGIQTIVAGQSIQTTSILAASVGVSVFNTTATTINIGGAANIANIGASNVVATFGGGTGNIVAGNIVANSATIAGTSVTGVNSILAGPTFTPLANTMGGFVSNVNNYTQLTIQNKSTGTDATTDFIATADNGNDTTNYLDLGIINSGYDNLTPTNSLGNIVFAADSYLYAQGNVSNVNQAGGNLAIGTTVAGKTIKFFAGGNTASNLVASFANTGANITGSLVVSGNITGANITGNINITGNVTGTSSNVTLVAGSYSTVFDNTGVATFPGVVKMSSLPAFRVYGSSSTDIIAGNAISATYGVTIDYNQTSSYNNTTGLFTAPVAGLYHTSATVRVGTNNGLNQAGIIKNSGGSGNMVAFWETDTNTGTATHFGMSGYIKLAAGDTLKLQSVAGKIQFDANDSWSVTFVG